MTADSVLCNRADSGGGAETSVQADLWFWSLNVDAARLKVLARHLSPSECARAERFVRPKDRACFIAARGGMREILAKALGQAPQDLVFRTTAHGKPFLPDGPAFNLSHSGGWAALAIGTGAAEIGIDIEAHRPVERALERLVCSAREAHILKGLPAPDRTRAFFRCWTRKEAYLKGCGEGLSRALDSIDVGPEHAPIAGVTRMKDGAGHPTGWIVRDLDLGPDFSGAVATEGAAHLRLFSHVARPGTSRLCLPRESNAEGAGMPIQDTRLARPTGVI